MSLTKKQKEDLAKAFQSAMEVSILNMKAPLRYINQYIAEDVSGYGTAADEKVQSRKDFRKMVMESRRQSRGMIFKARKITGFNPKFINETTVQFRDEIVLQIGDKKNKHILHLWFSTVYRLQNHKWQMVMFHGSMPDLGSSSSDTFHLSEAEKKLKELEQVVAQRTADLLGKTRELEIEASLERVRAATMGMNTPGDILNICKVFFKELQTLGFKDLRNTLINFWDDENGQLHDYDYSDFAGGNFAKLAYSSHPAFAAFQKKIRKAKDAFAKLVIKKDGLKSWQQRRRSSGEYKDPRLSKIAALYYYFYSTGVGALGISTFSPISKAEVEVLKKFRNVFDMAYQRYADIQKSEAQAKEAQIETALERVRSRTMGMQKSEELKEVIQVVSDQFDFLGINIEHTGFILDYKERDDMYIWLADKQEIQTQITLPYFDCAHWNSFIEAKEKGSDFFTNHLDIKEKNKFYKDLFKIVPGIPEEAKAYYFNAAGLAISTVLLDNVGLYIENFAGTPYTDEENNTLMRFGKVFQQTYTRFLDLQKAEAQARESQIQLALERVRARTMAMQKSEELAEVSYLLNKQVVELGIPTRGCAFNIYNERDSTEWFSNLDGTIPAYKTPRENIFLTYYEVGQRGETLWIEEFGGERIEEHYKYLATLSVSENEEETIAAGVAEVPEFQIDHVAYFKFGYLLFITLVHAPEAHEVFKRFAKEFEQSYTRFLDLQKAEAQAKEAQIETALEKVRSRTMAMQNSNELQETATVLFNEFKKLGTENIYQVTIGIYNEDEGLIDFRVTSWSGSGAQENRSFKLDMDEPTVLQPSVQAWKANKKSLVIDLSGGALEGWLKYRNKMSGITVSSADTAGRRVISIAYYSKGHLSISTPVPVPADTLHILERFASVFDSTYTRFLDLQKAEAQALRAEQDLIAIKEAKQKAEEALTELQATQKQLIQSEKMASLGELTAGIAHEIQNPLNFVNNFSEVSKELLDEMKEAIEKGDTDEAKEIMNDVIQNLEKINHHGKRADGIVKGMLQHSRSSSGQKELTDINALADEYFRLAYHGLRAKDKTFNAAMKTEYDELLEKVNVIPQDIGRVILNLITNAFYVVDEKKKSGIAGYEPTVSVSTKKMNDKVEIKVTDNGNGIPAKVLAKIFQPFFTTKPTGQGTGLGLSLAYDIVKAHGGELKVETKENEGTEFFMILPL